MPRVLAAFDDAVQATMQAVEAAMQTRVRVQGGQTDRVTGNILYARFTDFAARPLADGRCDPHLHAHCFVMNATFDPIEGRWKAGQGGQIARQLPYFEALFHAHLAKAVRALGYDTMRVGKFWEIAGVSAALREKFSRRTQVIADTAQACGITNPADKGRLGVLTRAHKDQTATLETLREAWQERLSPDERQALDQAARLHPAGPTITPEQALDYALAHGLERRSTLRETEVLECALRFGVGHVTVEDLRAALAVRRDILRAAWEGQTLLTTAAVLAEEHALIAFVQATKGTCTPFLSRAAAWKPPGLAGSVRLNDGQVQAVRHVLGCRDQIIAIRGGAGVGKTTLMREAVDTITAHCGQRVFVCAPNVEGARDVLRKEGFADADTVQKLLVSPALQARVRGQVLWVDEAGLLSVPQMHALFALAKRLQTRVILCGDTGQHHAVERGDALRLLEDQAGLVPAEVRTIVRQQGVYQQAVQAFRDGRDGEGWQHLERMGAVVAIDDTEDRLQRLARDYVRLTTKGGPEDAPTALVVAPTHAEGAQVTEAIRAHLRAQGRLAESEHPVLRLRSLQWTKAQRQDASGYTPGLVVECLRDLQVPGSTGWARGTRLRVVDITPAGVQGEDAQGRRAVLPLDQAGCFAVYRADTIGLAAGDIIRLTATVSTAPAPPPGFRRDHAGAGLQAGGSLLANGSRHTVAGVLEDGRIQLADGRVLDAACGHINYGYVLTSHAAQSKTVDHVLIAESALSYGAASREQWYVSLSRGKHSVTVYTDDAEGLRDAVCAAGQRLSATTLMAGRRRRQERQGDPLLPPCRLVSTHRMAHLFLATGRQARDGRGDGGGRVATPRARGDDNCRAVRQTSYVSPCPVTGIPSFQRLGL